MVVGPALPCSVPDFHVIVQEAVCSTTCWWLRSVGSTMHGPNWWHRYSLRSRTFRHPTRHLGRPLRTCSQSFPAEHGIPPRVVLYRMPLQSHARSRMDLQFAIRDEGGVALGGTVWTPSRRDRPRLGYVINARRSCSGWPAPARGLPSDPLRR